MNSEGGKAFAEASTDLAPTKGKIVIILDGVVQSAPAVQSAIPDGRVSITGNYTLDEAKSLQTVLESGSLPIDFEFEQAQTVGPTLGQDALHSGVLVAAVGLLLVMLYLLVFYRGLGFITAAAMLVFGTEGDGLTARTIEGCDYTVRIPMAHHVNSLNVAAASAVAFWELCR